MNLCRGDDENNHNRIDDENNIINHEEERHQNELLDDPFSNVNADVRTGALAKLGAVVRRRENIMDTQEFYSQMRLANNKQKELAIEVMYHLLDRSPTKVPLQIFLTSAAGCGKTWILKLIKNIYNMCGETDGHFNSYITCASTGKAAVAIDGTTVHTAFKITLGKQFYNLSNESVQLYRTLFKYVKVIIIDEVSMMSALLLDKINRRLQQITGNFDKNYGGLDMIFVGDLRQLAPVLGTPVYKKMKTSLVGPYLWQSLKLYQLNQVMRQNDVEFSSLLTKVGDGQILNEHELNLIEKRFFTQENAMELCPHGIRLYYSNQSVENYNNRILQQSNENIVSIATDEILGCKTNQEQIKMRGEMHKKAIIDTSGLPYQIQFVTDKPYVITTNIDVVDGLSNGAVGDLVLAEFNDDKTAVSRAWLKFPDSSMTGKITRKKFAARQRFLELDNNTVPIQQRTATIPLNKNKTINCKRKHFPLIPALALTIHKSQGGSYSTVVYEYDSKHPIDVVYVALSRVTNIQGLYITTVGNNPENFRFHHGREINTTFQHREKMREFKRLSENTLKTVFSEMRDFVKGSDGFSFITLNVRSLHQHAADLTDSITSNSKLLLLTETRMNNNENIEIQGFNCISKHKRSDKVGGVAIYHNKNDIETIISENIIPRPPPPIIEIYSTHVAPIGEICSCRAKLKDGRNVVFVSIYISPGHSLRDITRFIFETLMAYSVSLREIMKEYYDENFDEIPLVLAGDFNCNFSLDETQPLIQWLHEKFHLTMVSDPKISTRRDYTHQRGNPIDAVFSRFVNKIQTRVFVSYFSDHRPLISFIESEVNNEIENNSNN